MDPEFYMAVSNGHPDNHNPYRSWPTFKAHHFNKHIMELLHHYLHYPIGLANGSTAHNEADSRSPSASQEHFNLPAVDIRTTETDFYFDVELPGVTDKSSIGIHWVSSSSFIVEGDITRPWIAIPGIRDGESNVHADPMDKPLDLNPPLEEGSPEVKPVYNGHEHNSTTKAKGGDSPLGEVTEKRKADSIDSGIELDQNDRNPRIVLGERKIGSYRRRFKIPLDVDVDVKGTDAKLNAGVLTIRIPRKEPYNQNSTPQMIKVPVS